MAERGESGKGSKEDKDGTKKKWKFPGVGRSPRHHQSQTDGAATHELQERSPEHEHVRMKRSVSPRDESAATGFRSRRSQTFSGRSGDYHGSSQPVPLSPKEAKRQEKLREKEEKQRKAQREREEKQRKEEEKQRKAEEKKVKKAQPKKSKTAGVLPGRKGRSEVAMSPTKGVPESPVLESVDRGTTSPVGDDGPMSPSAVSSPSGASNVFSPPSLSSEPLTPSSASMKSVTVAERQQLEATIQQLRDELTRQGEENRQVLQQKEHEYKQRLHEMEEERKLLAIAHKSSRGDTMKRAQASLQQKLEEVQAELAEKEAASLALRSQLARLQKAEAEKATLEKHVQKLTHEKEACNSIVTRQQQEALTKQQELLKVRQEIELERMDKGKADANYQQASEVNKELKKQLQLLQAQIQEQGREATTKEEELQTQLQKDKQEAEAARNELQQKEERLRALQATLDQEHQQKEEFEKKAREVEEAAALSQAATSEAERRLQAELHDVQKKLEDQKLQLANDLQAQVQKLERQHQVKLDEKEEEHRASLERLREQSQKQMQEERERVGQEVHKVAQLRQEESKRYWDLQQAELGAEVEALRQKVVEKDAQIEQLQSEDLRSISSSEPPECVLQEKEEEEEEDNWEEEGGEEGEYVSAPSSLQDPQPGQTEQFQRVLEGFQTKLEETEAQKRELEAKLVELEEKVRAVGEREGEAEELREQMDGMSAKLEERDTRIKSLEDTVRKRTNSPKSEQEADLYLDQLTKLTEQVTEHEVNSAKMKRKITEQEVLIKRAEKQDESITKATEDLSALELELKQMKEEKRKLQLRHLPSDQVNVVRELQAQAENVKPLQEKVEKLKADLRHAEERRERMEQENRWLKDSAVVREQLKAREDEVRAVNDPADTMSLSGSEDSLSLSSLGTAKGQIRKLKHDLAEREKGIHNLQAQARTFQDLARREEQVYDHSKHQSQEVLRLKRQLQELEATTHQLQEESDDLREELEDVKETKDTEAQEYQRRLREQEEEVKLLREEYQRLLDMEKAMIGQPPGKESSVDSEDPIEVMKGVISATEQSRQEVFQQLQAAKVKVTSLEQANHDLQMGNKRLAAQTGHVTHLSSQLEVTRREIEKLMKEKEELQGDRDALKAQADTYREDFELERRERGEAAGHVVDREGRTAFQFQQYHQQMEAEVQQYKAQMKRQQEEYDHLLEKFDELQLQFVSHKEKYEQAPKPQTQKHFIESPERIDELLSTTARLSDEVLMKTQQVKQYEKKVEAYKAQRDQAIQQAERYKGQLGMAPQQGGANMEESDMRIATAESEKEEVKRQLHDMKLERDQLTSEVETLRLKLMEFARSHDGQEVHPEVERRFAALAERYTLITQENEALKAALHQSRVPYPRLPEAKMASDEPIPRARLEDPEPHQHAVDLAQHQRPYAGPQHDDPQLPHLRSRHPGSQVEQFNRPHQEVIHPIHPRGSTDDRRAPQQGGYYPPNHASPVSPTSHVPKAFPVQPLPHNAGYRMSPRYGHDGVVPRSGHTSLGMPATRFRHSMVEPIQQHYRPSPPEGYSSAVGIVQHSRSQAGDLPMKTPVYPPDGPVQYQPHTPPPASARGYEPPPSQLPTSKPGAPQDPQRYDAPHGSSKPGGGTLMHGLSLDISQTVKGYERDLGESFEETTPLDPNLVCPLCNKQFRIGEIQAFRSHVQTCTGT